MEDFQRRVSNLVGMASNLLAMALNLVALASVGLGESKSYICSLHYSCNNKLLGTSATLLVTSALLVVTMFATRNKLS